MKRFKVWLVLAFVFCAGFAGGMVTTQAVARRVLRAAIAHPEVIRERIERDLRRKLRLEARQRAEVDQVLLRSQEQLKELRREFQPKLRTILRETRRDISALLTPEQRARFERYLAEHPLPTAITEDGPDSK